MARKLNWIGAAKFRAAIALLTKNEFPPYSSPRSLAESVNWDRQLNDAVMAGINSKLKTGEPLTESQQAIYSAVK